MGFGLNFSATVFDQVNVEKGDMIDCAKLLWE